MKKILVVSAILGSLALASASQADGIFGASEGAAKNDLGAAHAAYARGDFRAMSEAMKNALLANPDDALVRENVFGLYNAAYSAAGSEGVPANWSLPNEVAKMRVTIRRAHREESHYTLKVYGAMSELGTIKQLQVERYPGVVVLDKEAGIGEWEEEAPRTTSDLPEYSLEGPRSRQAIPAGLYLLRLTLANGQRTDGWFLIDEEMNPTTSPEIETPAVGEVFATSTPTFRWSDYRSPQYKPYERRSVWMGVSLAEPPNYEWDLKWDFFQDSPTLEQVTIGSNSGGFGATSLEDGRYVFYVKYTEVKRFGDIMIGRDGASSRIFQIRH